MTTTEGAALPGPPDSKSDALGRVVAGKYALGGVLAKNGPTAVFRALGLELRRPVALKLIRRADGRTKERFLSLRERVTGLHHPGIVTVLDAGETPEHEVFVAMELLQGETLAERLLREERVPAEQVVALGTALCAALAAAHAHGLLHGDVKPSNVFLAREPDGTTVPKLLDVGLGRRVSVDPAVVGRATLARRDSAYLQLAPRDVSGTPRYLAPEQLRGEEPDGRADVYALGATLYEAIAGSPPFPADDLAGLLAKILWERPEPLTKRAPDAGVPEALDRVVARALAKAPGQRFADPAEFGRALGDAMKPEAAGTGLPDEEVVLPLVRLRLGTPAAALVVGVALALFFLLWWGAPDRPVAPADAAAGKPPGTHGASAASPRATVAAGVDEQASSPSLAPLTAPLPTGTAHPAHAPASSAMAAPAGASAAPPTSFRIDDLKTPF